MLSPDEIFSSELGDVIVDSIAEGVGLLLLPTIRLATEPFFSAMAAEGCDLNCLPKGGTVDISSRSLATAALASLHPEILAGEWGRVHFGDYINSIWWNLGRSHGILLHTFSFIPLLMDYSLVEDHDLRDALISSTDGPYLARNFPPGTKIKIIDDAETVFTASWAPYARRAAGILRPKWAFTIPWLGERLKGAYLRQRYRYYVVECRDWIKAALFTHPIRWRIGGEDDDWTITDRKANLLLSKHLPGYAPANVGIDWTPDELDRRLSSGWNPIFDRVAFWYQRCRACFLAAKEYWMVIWDAARGNKAALRRIMRRVAQLWRPDGWRVGT
jgi:hypothetical protein